MGVTCYISNISLISILLRKVVDHICLLKAKEDLSDEEEKDMLDFLYTTQYQMRGILSVSLGELYLYKINSQNNAVSNFRNSNTCFNLIVFLLSGFH